MTDADKRRYRNDRATLNRWIKRYKLNPLQALWAEAYFLESGLAVAEQYILGVKPVEKMEMPA